MEFVKKIFIISDKGKATKSDVYVSVCFTVNDIVKNDDDNEEVYYNGEIAARSEDGSAVVHNR